MERHEIVSAVAAEGVAADATPAAPSVRRELRLELPAFGGSAKPPLILFLGDSLVSGVGAQDRDAAPAAAVLPKSVAAGLARLGAGPVRWASVGITGADVKQLRDEGLPKLREKIKSYTAQAETVVVVLVVGTNDLRKAQLSSYRLQLRSLVDELRHTVCKERTVDAVVLPELRMEDAPLLNRFPLNYFVGPVCALWEREKQKAIDFLAEAHVLPYPDFQSQQKQGERSLSLFCADGMHPSAHGYKCWADNIAQQIHSLLQDRQARRSRPDDSSASQVSWATMPL